MLFLDGRDINAIVDHVNRYSNMFQMPVAQEAILVWTLCAEMDGDTKMLNSCLDRTSKMPLDDASRRFKKYVSILSLIGLSSKFKFC